MHMQRGIVLYLPRVGSFVLSICQVAEWTQANLWKRKWRTTLSKSDWYGWMQIIFAHPGHCIVAVVIQTELHRFFEDLKAHRVFSLIITGRCYETAGRWGTPLMIYIWVDDRNGRWKTCCLALLMKAPIDFSSKKGFSGKHAFS